MEKKVFIFGDSYADPKGCPSYAWHNLLKEKYIVCNYGETGTGPQYSFDRFYDLELQSDDTVVFLLSDPHRINFYGGSLLKGELSHIVWDEKSKKSYCVFEKYSDNMLTSRHMKILDYHKKHKDQIDFLFLTQERELLKGRGISGYKYILQSGDKWRIVGKNNKTINKKDGGGIFKMARDAAISYKNYCIKNNIEYN